MTFKELRNIRVAKKKSQFFGEESIPIQCLFRIQSLSHQSF